MSAIVIPIGGEHKKSNLEEFLESLKENDFSAVYLIMGDNGNCVFGHTAKNKSELICSTYELNKLVEHFINAQSLGPMLNKEDDDDEDDE